MSILDKNIVAIWTGFLVACIIILITTNQTEQCVAYVKDGNGNVHVLTGWTGYK